MLSLYLSLPHEDIAGKYLPANQEESSHQKPSSASRNRTENNTYDRTIQREHQNRDYQYYDMYHIPYVNDGTRNIKHVR